MQSHDNPVASELFLLLTIATGAELNGDVLIYTKFIILFDQSSYDPTSRREMFKTKRAAGRIEPKQSLAGAVVSVSSHRHSHRVHCNCIKREGRMNLKTCAIVAGAFMLAGTTSWVVHAQTVRSEAAAHPRIATAIRSHRLSGGRPS